MKKLIILSLVIFGLCSKVYLKAQDSIISKEDAWKIVQKEVLNGKTSDINAYQWVKPFLKNSLIDSRFLNIKSPDFDSWFFFLDEMPLANWGHPCKYVFVNIKDGTVELKMQQFPPDLENFDILIEYRPVTNDGLFKFDKWKKTTKNVCSNANDYAVIISGGASLSSNYERYWNNCSAIYSALLYIYHFDEDHIYVLMSDGTSSANDRKLVAGGYDSSPLDLDGDEDDDIDYSATYSNINTVFNELGGILDSNDNLFIFVTDHGGTESWWDTYLNLWDSEEIDDDQFAAQVDKVDAGKIIITMDQCYAGGFIDDLQAENCVISTASDYDEPSYARTDLLYDEFVYHWISAVTGQTPGEEPVDADYNDNGIVSIEEAFVYANTNDTKDETPQYSSDSNVGYYLALNGNIPYISGDMMVCYSSNRTFTLNNYPSNTSVSWSCSNNLSTVGSTTTTYTVHAYSSSSTGIGWVQAYITDPNQGCNPITPLTIRLNPWVGVPTLSYVSGPYEGYTETHYDYYAYPYNLEAYASYYWSLSPSYNYSMYTYSNYADIIYWEPDSYQISARAENTCGSTDWIPTYTSIYSGYGFFIYPNPASDFISITMNDTKAIDRNNQETRIKKNEINNLNLYTIRIYNNQGQLIQTFFRTGNEFTIPVYNLQNGNYIVSVGNESRSSSNHLLINH